MLPYLNAGSEHGKKYIVAFQGLNYGQGYADGEFSECENLSAAEYPCISQRAARTVEGHYAAPTGLHAKEGLVVIDGTSVLYNGEAVGTVTAGRKQMATIGNYVVIFPDKVYLNAKTKEFRSMEERYTATGLKFTDSTITTKGDAWPFKVGDAVQIRGCSTTENNREAERSIIVRGVSGQTMTFSENAFTAAEESGSVTISREVPDLEHICENNYRLWGVKGNTIYGSKYSDPFNFYYYDTGTADAAYWIDVGTDGEFTGCVPYSSHICFFKEHYLHKLYGSKPSNFQLVHSQVYGVQAGSERSMQVINETLYYKGVNGVYAYTGGVPELISDKFGTRRFADACGASDGGSKYYISMRSGLEWGLWVYDVLRGLWLREDGLHCVDMTFHDGHVWLLAADGTLYKVDETEDRSQVAWSVTFAPFNETVNERKGYSKFHLRLEMDAGSQLEIDMKRNLDKTWTKVYSTTNEKARTLTVPVIPARCDSVEIRLRGKGECRVRTFIREFFEGSDV